MLDMKLTEDEVAILKLALSSLSVKSRTGELGVMHAGRFVSVQGTQPVILKKEEKEILDKVAKKVGLGGLSSFNG